MVVIVIAFMLFACHSSLWALLELYQGQCIMTRVIIRQGQRQGQRQRQGGLIDK